MTGGWLIGVMVAAQGAPVQRYYYAIGHADQARAEWAAVDHAIRLGQVATSPVHGSEPVEAIRPLTAQRMADLGLAPGEVRELGWRRPRRWLT